MKQLVRSSIGNILFLSSIFPRSSIFINHRFHMFHTLSCSLLYPICVCCNIQPQAKSADSTLVHFSPFTSLLSHPLPLPSSFLFPLSIPAACDLTNLDSRRNSLFHPRFSHLFPDLCLRVATTVARC